MQLTKEQIQQIIPHRPPFLLIDEILETEPGKSVTALKTLLPSEYYLAGHFPGHPIMPGVLIMEALAQAGAVAVLSLPEYAGRIAVITRMNNVEFRRQVIPGDQLRLEVEITKLSLHLGLGKGAAFIIEGSANNKLAARGEMEFRILPNKSD